MGVAIKIRPGLTRIVYSGLDKTKRQGTSLAQFKPLKIKHGTKNGSPMLHSRKEVNTWLQKNNLISPLFTD